MRFGALGCFRWFAWYPDTHSIWFVPLLAAKGTFPATFHHTVSGTIHRCRQAGTRPSMRLGGCTGEVVPGAGSMGYLISS